MHKCASINRHFFIVMVYWHTLKVRAPNKSFIKCLLQSQINACYNKSQGTYTSFPILNVNHNFWVKENLFSSFCNLVVILAPLVSITSNNTMVTWFSSQSLEIKLTTTTNTSCAPFDIHKSKCRWLINNQPRQLTHM